LVTAVVDRMKPIMERLVGWGRVSVDHLLAARFGGGGKAW
jgi:hypothetical protein